jgi:putative NADH-flavin reductase
LKLTIFGASGNTGLELVKQALEKGHLVTAFVRDPSRLSIKHDHLEIFAGDVVDSESVAKAVQGQDVVICALGAGSDLKQTTVRTTGTTNIVQAMKQHGVQRLLIISAMGTGDSWDTLSLISKFLYATLLKNSREDHEAQESVVKKSGLDWTIIRPSGLTNDPQTGIYDVGENIPAKTSRISRADIAYMLLKEVEQNILLHKAVTITK